jgi:uncharacterized membrane protein
MPQAGQQPVHRPWREPWLGVSALTLLGAVLRLAALGRKSFWLDELSSIGIASSPLPVFKDAILHHEGNMALYYVLLRMWLSVGTLEATVRLLSALAGIAAIPLMYFLARRFFKPETAGIAAALLAVSPGAIVYSQEARGYSLLVLAVLASTYAFVALIGRPSIRAAVAYGVLAPAMAYCHFFGALVIAAQFLSLAFLARHRLPRKYLFASAVTMALLGWPIVWMVFTQDSAHLDWVPRVSWLELYHLGIFLAGESGKALAAVLLSIELALIFLFVRTVVLQWRADDDLADWKDALLLNGLITPVLISLLASLLFRPVFFHRFLIICLPFWLIMVAGGIDQIGSRELRRWSFIGISVLSVFVAVASYSKPREDWRGAAQYLIAQRQPDDHIVCYRDYACFALQTYAGTVLGKPELFTHTIGISRPDGDWATQLDDAQRAWFIGYPSNSDDANARTIGNELSQNYNRVEQRDFQSISVVQYRHK